MDDSEETRHELEHRLDKLKEKYDVVIVGAGIYGASLSWEASSRGLSVLLVEQNDFGSATSQNSLKIIHGGIRYLQSFNFKRVIESIQESKNLVRIAPYLVKPLECVATLNDKSSIERFKIKIGLTLYNLLAFNRNRNLPNDRKFGYAKLIGKDDAPQKFENLSIKIKKSCLNWFDGRVTNTERLTLAFIMSAVRNNADAMNYIKCEKFVQDSDDLKRVTIFDKLSEKRCEISATSIFYCVGPWMRENNSYTELFHSEDNVKLVRGVNIVVNRKPEKFALGIQQSSPSNRSRYLFFTPWKEQMMIGTWYFNSVDSPRGAKSISEDELREILSEVNSTLPSANLKLNDISLIHQGELPALNQNNASLEEGLLEKNSFFSNNLSGTKHVYFLQGVKYTTARSVAVKAINLLRSELPIVNISNSISHLSPLYGGDMGSEDGLFNQLNDQYPLTERILRRLVSNYGTISKDILLSARDNPQLYGLVPGSIDIIKIEINFLIENEMALTVSDLVQRRLGVGSSRIPPLEILEYCAAILKKYYGYDRETIAMQINNCINDYPSWSRP